jgi:hypothetical protein
MGKHVSRVSRWGDADHSRIYACYTGCMLGFSLTVTPFRAYAKEYPKHRERMIRCFTELGANVTLPVHHKDYFAQHEAILTKVQDEIGRVAHACLGWTLFGSAAMQFAIKHAFRSREAANIKRAAAVYLDKMELPRAVLTKLGRASRVEKDGRLSLYTLHTAALAMLNKIIGRMKREPKTAFVAIPFSVPRMSGYYASLYRPLLKELDFRPLRAWGGFGTEDYQDLLYTLLDRCGCMLADISTLNPNVMHEVGYAIGKGDKFIMLIADQHQSVPPNLGDLTVLKYKAKGRGWQSVTVGELATAVALYRYAAVIDLPGETSRSIIGPMKVTR